MNRALEVTVEIPQGERNKYELDQETGRIRLDRQLFTATRYPAEYGFLDHTLGRDDNPLDALVLTEAPTFPGCVIRARPIGMFVMDDEHGSDNKILTVPHGDPRYDGLQDIEDLAAHRRAEIAHFFEVYKELEPGTQVTGTRWASRADALTEINDAESRHHQQRHRAQNQEHNESDEHTRPHLATHADDAVVRGPQLRIEGPTRASSSGASAPTHLVLGYRAGTLGQRVLHHGADLASRLWAALHVVHVVDLSDYRLDPDSPDWEEQAQQTLAAEHHEVATALAGLPGSWTYHAAHGDPVALLRCVADSYDALMFIVGSRDERAGRLASRLVGARPSVSHGLIARSHRPVLVVPPHAIDPER